MTDINSTLITLFASIALVCAVLVLILLRRDRMFDKQVAQCVEMQKALARGISYDELLKMPMPRKLRAKFKQTHDYWEILAEIREFIKEIEGNEQHEN